MKKFIKGLRERLAPEHETDLMASWGWTPVEPTVVAKGRKETVSADPTVVPPKEDGSQLNQGEQDDGNNSW